MTTTENGAEPLLRLKGVSKNFGPVQALADVDLEVPAGQVTALIGDNGAGKSVMIKMHRGDPRSRTRADLLGREAGPDPHAPRGRRARHRDRLPGSRAL